MLRSLFGEAFLLPQTVYVIGGWRWCLALLVAVVAAGQHASTLQTARIAGAHAVIHNPMHRFGQIEEFRVATMIADGQWHSCDRE